MAGIVNNCQPSVLPIAKKPGHVLLKIPDRLVEHLLGVFGRKFRQQTNPNSPSHCVNA